MDKWRDRTLNSQLDIDRQTERQLVREMILIDRQIRQMINKKTAGWMVDRLIDDTDKNAAGQRDDIDGQIDRLKEMTAA